MGGGRDGAHDGLTKEINPTPNLSLVTPLLALILPGPPWPMLPKSQAPLCLTPASVTRPPLKFSLKPQMVHCVSSGKCAVVHSAKYKVLGAARKSNLYSGGRGDGRQEVQK